jgi:hypothetical protein
VRSSTSPLAGDDIERALAKVLEPAAVAGRWDLVAQLVAELRARRAQRQQ